MGVSKLYKKPCALVVTMSEDLPKFGCVQDIFYMNQKVYLRLELFDTVFFSQHYHAYVIESQRRHAIVVHSDLELHIPLHPRTVVGLTRVGQTAIVLKHYLSSL